MRKNISAFSIPSKDHFAGVSKMVSEIPRHQHSVRSQSLFVSFLFWGEIPAVNTPSEVHFWRI